MVRAYRYTVGAAIGRPQCIAGRYKRTSNARPYEADRRILRL